MTRYICRSCNFCFELKSEKAPKNCPNCGRIGMEKEPSAERLLEDLEE